MGHDTAAVDVIDKEYPLNLIQTELTKLIQIELTKPYSNRINKVLRHIRTSKTKQKIKVLQYTSSAFLKPWVTTQMCVSKTMRMGREGL